MALAAETRAAAVASFDRMTPTRTLSAARVWLRARERISVIVRPFSLTKILPTPQLRSGRPMKAISETRSCRPLRLDEKNVRHDRCRDHFKARTPIPPGAIRIADDRGEAACGRGAQSHAAGRRVRACRLKNERKVRSGFPSGQTRSISLETCSNGSSDGSRFATPLAVCVRNVASRMAAAVRFETSGFK